MRARMAGLTLLLTLGGCTSAPAATPGDVRSTAADRARDLTRSGSIATRVGASVPAAVCSRAARVAASFTGMPGLSRLAAGCAQAGRL